MILDSELAAIYGVSTGRFNEAVKRNIGRFPEDFMLRLTRAEHTALISQIATSNPGRGGRRKLPWAAGRHRPKSTIPHRSTSSRDTPAAPASPRARARAISTIDSRLSIRTRLTACPMPIVRSVRRDPSKPHPTPTLLQPRVHWKCNIGSGPHRLNKITCAARS